ncbi:MAG: nucleotidyltransferase domain-containing protein [Lachnospiraceae bacterium]|nr:nucleotidyltransferase domain-containing protein [Lachnospiraceae bacterium]
MVLNCESNLFKKLVPAVREIYGDNLLYLILYGSVARNVATEDSDIDIALIVREDDHTMYDDMLDVVVDLDLEYDQVISTALIKIDEYEKWKKVLPFYRNIDKEGIILWKAA